MRTATRIVVLFVSLFWCMLAFAGSVRGIYITQPTFEDTPRLKYLIAHAKASGINTFVVDYDRDSRVYAANVPLLRQNGIHYVARITVFPNGGTPDRINSIPYREGKLHLMEEAVALGADAIQLDYIRYNTSLGRSDQHVTDVDNVIQWFRDHLSGHHVALQVDVFGITSFGPEKHIGQDVRQIAQHADVLCPMDYPSHFQPFAHYSAQPEATVHDALIALKSRFGGQVPVRIVPWIEMSNYHYALSDAARQRYIAAQIRGVEASGVDGWYAWSPNNYYDNLFQVLESGD